MVIFVEYLVGSVGPGKLIAVSAGDEIEAEVNVVYTDKYLTATPEIGTSSVVTAVASIFGGVSGGNVEQQAIYDLFNGSDVTNYLDNRQIDTDNPKAYLNYIRFDQDFNYIDGSFDQVQNAENTHETLSVGLSFTGQNLKAGYVYVWISNESGGSAPVYFDDLEITHTKGAILQEDHYYPFGMSINALSSSAPLSTPNKYKYNGFEEQTEFDLGWYDYQARQYDPQLGRFTQVDPAADLMRRHSPYNYAFDNPIRFIDPDGMMPTDAVSALDEWRSGKYDEADSEATGELLAEAWFSTEDDSYSSYRVVNGELSQGWTDSELSKEFMNEDKGTGFTQLSYTQRMDYGHFFVFHKEFSEEREGHILREVITYTIMLSADGTTESIKASYKITRFDQIGEWVLDNPLDGMIVKTPRYSDKGKVITEGLYKPVLGDTHPELQNVMNFVKGETSTNQRFDFNEWVHENDSMYAGIAYSAIALVTAGNKYVKFAGGVVLTVYYNVYEPETRGVYHRYLINVISK